MARIALLAAFLGLASVAMAMTPAQFGMEMGTTAYEAVCWYENLKQFPTTNTKQFLQCTNQADHAKKDILKRIGADEQQKYYSLWLPARLSALPADYSSKCKSDLESGSSDGSGNEGDALNDQGHEYPFRAFAYCMMKTLRGRHGDKSIDAVKSERTHSLKDWVSTINDRENEFRARHGVQPLQPVQQLMDLAQKWSDQNAALCKTGYHIPDDHPDYKWNGAATGENLAGGTGPDDKSVNAYAAINGWYEEIKNYPFPGGVNKMEEGNGVIGHFTQTVWAGSKYVGYGYAYNENCPGSKIFLTARYWNAGNMEGAFRDNVKPPQN